MPATWLVTSPALAFDPQSGADLTLPRGSRLRTLRLGPSLEVTWEGRRLLIYPRSAAALTLVSPRRKRA